jgi:hypothetical protein
MKSEHRHELQTNELGKYAEKLAIFIDVHGNRLMIGVCLACLPLAGIIYWYRTTTNNEAAAWRDFAAAVSNNKADDFLDVWESHKSTPVGLWARVHEGETRLTLGVETMFRNVDAGLEELKKAKSAFQSVADDKRAPQETRERALIGLGRAIESMSDGSETDALKAYEMLVKDYPNSIYKSDAEGRIAALKKPDSREFYAWFAKYPRPKFEEKRPRDKISGDDSESVTQDMIDKLNETVKGLGKKPSDQDAETPEETDPEKPDAEQGEPKSEPQPDKVPEPESKSP